MDEKCLCESGVMLIRANRALIRGRIMLPDGSGPYFLLKWCRVQIASMLQTIEGGYQMKRFKERRNMKVYGMSGYNYKPTPTIMLKGQWLKEAEAAFMEKETRLLQKRFEEEKENLRIQFVAEGKTDYNSCEEKGV